ncbi:MAG: TIGR04211 family SH3 domain-containing protein [Desulfotalea sp.]
MLRLHKYLSSSVLLMIVSLAIISVSHATATKKTSNTRYVTDILTINIRDKINPPYKILQRVSSDHKLKVIKKEGKYLQVKTNSGKIGWISKQYTTKTTPKAITIVRLKKELDQIKNKSTETVDSQEIIKLREALTTKDKEIIQLKKTGNKNITPNQAVDKLTKQNETLLAQIVLLEKKIQNKSSMPDQQTIANLNIKTQAVDKNQNIYLFLAGALTLLFGIIVGKIPRRKQKSRTFYS